VKVVLFGGPLDGTELAVKGIPPTIDFSRISDPVSAPHSEPLEEAQLFRETYSCTGRITGRRHVYSYEGVTL
jgi:hypothetical protein